ncbi:hypothetical protein BFP72_15770 [Reichenbachiella sp. 5M10]|nr:hypothetical protein [Reichenbachiella sp. 5M10]PIB36753.1 hypothetical protein BFP72_15770 [Reichenbachiella sp. 5M10]
MENHQSFESYLISKKIDSAKFKLAEQSLYEALASDFEQMHPDSFTQQKLFLINPLRRKYLAQEPSVSPPISPRKIFKPKIQK